MINKSSDVLLTNNRNHFKVDVSYKDIVSFLMGFIDIKDIFSYKTS